MWLRRVMLRDNNAPSGKPSSTLTRIVTRSFGVHFSSTPPDEKKNTECGARRSRTGRRGLRCAGEDEVHEDANCQGQLEPPDCERPAFDHLSSPPAPPIPPARVTQTPPLVLWH